MTNNDFIVTTALKKLLKLKKRIKVVPGGTSAGKTYSTPRVALNEAMLGWQP